MRTGIFGTIILIFSITSASVLIWSSITTFSKTYDEPFHIDWNTRLLKEGNSERESVYNYISTTPILSLNIAFGEKMTSLYPLQTNSHLRWSRLPGLFWFFILLLSSYLLALHLGGSLAATVTAGFLCFEPNLLAHSALITTDVPFAASAILTVYCTLRLREDPKLLWGLLLGVALGLTFASKFTAFLLVPFVVLVPLLRKQHLRDIPSLLYDLSLLLLAATICAAVLCLFYQGIEVAKPLGEFRFFNETFRSLQTAFPWLMLPLPADFITGFDHLMEAGKRDEWNNILFMTWLPDGVWNYYLISWIFKTPLALIVLQVSALVFFLRDTLRNAVRPQVLLVAGFAIFCLIYLSLFVRVQVGYRYALFLIPVLSASLVAHMLTPKRLSSQRQKIVRWGFPLLVLISALEVLPYSQNLLSFTNQLIPNKELAYQVLSDSNLDWGQNRDREGEIRASLDLPPSRLNPPHLLPGKNLFSVNELLGVFWNFEQHRWLRENLTPQDHYGHTLLLFDVSSPEFLRFLREERSLTPLSSDTCSGQRSFPSLEQPRNVVVQNQEQICVPAMGNSYLQLEVRLRSAYIGAVTKGGECQKLRFPVGGIAWFYLPDEGHYALCIEPEGSTATTTWRMVAPNELVS